MNNGQKGVLWPDLYEHCADVCSSRCSTVSGVDKSQTALDSECFEPLHTYL